MQVRKYVVGALVGGMLLVGPAAAFAGDNGGLLGGGDHGLLGGGLIGDGCKDGELVSVAGAYLVGVNLDGLRGTNLNHGLIGHDDGQLLGVGGQNDGDKKNALIVTGPVGDLEGGLIGLSLGDC